MESSSTATSTTATTTKAESIPIVKNVQAKNVQAPQSISVPKSTFYTQSRSSKTSSDEMEKGGNISDQLNELFGANWRLVSNLQVLPFSKIISNATIMQQNPKQLLDIMVNCQDKQIWKTFIATPLAITALYNLRTLIGQTGPLVYDYLKVLSRLPFDLNVFKECNLVLYVKTVKKKNLEHLEINKLADSIRRTWQAAAESQALKSRPTDKSSIISSESSTILNKNTDSTISSVEKRPFHNIQGRNIDAAAKRFKQEDKKSASSFFKRLNEPAVVLPKIKTADSIINNTNNSDQTSSAPVSANISSSEDVVQLPSYRKSSAGSLDVDMIPADSNKKSVRFKNPTELQSIKTFEKEDPPRKIVIITNTSRNQIIFNQQNNQFLKVSRMTKGKLLLLCDYKILSKYSNHHQN